ncbi:VCBS repeat-containing protein [Waterburya agarophytonicola K14]|uniref:VCBS repeat-containing protein n=1 Tax=Waterburya agarophytonicola KI4 TaxID=2874699 RepID=A0A964BUF7_9CYAN|nr:FG-GAP-like repeat-containing protein [Waterburya agarophytonicola]MCC0178897.1 VCBS repeat-containing protein [Waterburya agarophytonicola KI4]
MSKVNISSSFSNVNDAVSAEVLENSQDLANNLIAQFADRSDFSDRIKLVFNNGTDINRFRSDWRTGNFVLPEIEVVSSQQINGANGAFSSQTGKIYLAEEFLLANQSDTEAVAKVIIEEYGHYIDSQINSSDTPGDEGAIFAALVLGEDLSSDRLQELRGEDDSAVVVIDGESIAIEQALVLREKGSTTNSIYIDGLLLGETAPFLGTDNTSVNGETTFTYSFLGEAFAGLDDFGDRLGGFARETINWNDAEIDAVTKIFPLIENIANIKFEPASESNRDIADLKFFKTTPDQSDIGKFFGRAWTPEFEQRGIIYFNSKSSHWNDIDQQGSSGFSILFHELMHSLGLDHPFEGERYPGVNNEDDFGENNLNSGLWTAMSYNHFNILGVDEDQIVVERIPGTPMGFDIAALQYLYGANTSYENGDSEYRLDDIEGKGFQAIWDTGGNNDVITAAGLDRGVRIALRNMPLNGNEFTFRLSVSHIGSFDNATSGFTIAPFPLNVSEEEKTKYIIENAIGSDENDTIFGNDSNNILRGEAENSQLFDLGGNDFIKGYGGNDVIYGEIGNDSLFGDGGSDSIVGGSGNDLISGRIGSDTLLGGADSDTISGGRGNDTIFGGDGNDLIHGGSSDSNEIDVLVGGSGNDIFYLGNEIKLSYGLGNGKGFALIRDYQNGDGIAVSPGIGASELFTEEKIYNNIPGLGIYYNNDAIAFLENVTERPRFLTIRNPNNSVSSASVQQSSTSSTTFNLTSTDESNFSEPSDAAVSIGSFDEVINVEDSGFFVFDGEDIGNIQDGLSGLLTDIGQDVIEEITGDNLFLNLIADSLSDANFGFFDNIAGAISSELDLTDVFTPQAFVSSINQKFADNDLENVSVSLIEDNDYEVIFGLNFTESPDTGNITFNARSLADLGLPLSFTGGVDFDFDASAAINFGVSVDTNEFFVDTGLQREVDVNLNIQNTDTLKTELGNFAITASDRSIDPEEELFEENPGKAFQASLNFGLDLQDTSDDGDGRLTTDEIVDSSLEPSLIGELNINPLLEISTGISEVPDLDITLDYNAQYNFIEGQFVAPEEVITPDNVTPPALFLDGEEVNSGNFAEIVGNRVSDIIVDNLGLSRIVQEFDRFLAQIEDTLGSDIFELDIPFIGDALSGNLDATGFISDIRNSLSNGFQNFAASGVEALVKEIGSLEYITANSTEDENEIVINIGLDSEDGQPIGFETNLAPDLGVLDSLGLDISAEADINLDFQAENALQVTINKTDGAIDFNLGGDSSGNDPSDIPDDLTIDLSLNLPQNTVFNGSLGFLDVELESALGNNDLSFGVGIDLDTFDYEFDYSDLSVIDLYKLEVSAPDLGDIGGLPTVTLPSFSTLLSFDFSQINTDSDGEVELPFIFKDVSINAESLSEGFLGSFVNTLDPIIGENSEIGTFVRQISADIEPLSNVNAIREFFDNPNSEFSSGNGDGEVSLIEVATNPFVGQFVGDEAPEYEEFLESVRDIAEFTNDLDTFSNTLSLLADGDGNINLGDITLNNLSSGNLTPTFNNDDEGFKEAQPEAKEEVGETEEGEFVLPQGLKIPLFDDPLGTAFNVLTGANNVSLIEYTIPELSFSTELSKFFPVVGPLGVRLGGSLSANANLGFGFDTYGLQTGNQVQGFYFLDRHEEKDNEGNLVLDSQGNPVLTDLPEFNLNARVTAEGGAELGVGRGFVGGNLTGDVDFDLVDPDNDGRIRPNEISGDLSDLFDVSAELTAGLQAWFEVGYGRLSVREDFDFGSITLLEIEPNEPPFNPALGYVVDGTLILNQGSDRAVAKDITNELFQIAQTPDGAIQIVAFNNTQSFSGVNLISGNGKDDNDTLEAFVEVTVAAEFDGGSGNDSLIGGSGDDTLLGGNGNDTLEGKAGNDSLIGGSGDDRLFGGTGNDELKGDRGNDNLVGDAGNDILEGDRGRDTLAGGAGNDNLSGGSDRDTLYGDVGNDILDGGSDADYLEGEEGNDSLRGEFGEDTLYGGEGEDTLEGGDSDDYLDGGANNDTLLGESGEDTLYGRTGNDSLDGGFGEDVLYGEAGNDILFGNLGADTLYGAAGADSLIGGVDNDLLEGAIGNDTLEGSDGADTLLGEEGNDSLLGGQGEDSLVGSVGNDELDGEAGEDELYGDSGRDILRGGSDDDELYGGIDDDNLAGGSENDELYGGEGNDELSGDAGEDTLEGESGDDTLRGGSDTDVLIGGGGEDLLDGETGTDSLFGGFGEDILRGGAQDDVLYGEGGKDTLEGGTDNDTLFGGADDDSLEGGSGNDSLLGEAGFDILDGQAGDDILDGGESADTLNGGDGNDIVRGGEDNDLLQGDDENSFEENSEEFNDTLEGEAGDDELFGASGNDVLIGGDGDDTLAGGFGDDTLIGDDPEESNPEEENTEESNTEENNTENESKGKNVFVLAPNQGTDIIKDFTLLPENFDPETQEIDDADIILLSDGLSFNFIEIVEGEVVDSEGNIIQGAAIIDKDTNETLAILEGIEPERLSRAYFDEENVAPDRLEFESKKPVYAQDETVTLVNTLVRDANGIQDVELIDFWLRGYEGADVWTDLNNFLTDLNGNIGFSDLNNLNPQTPIGEQITINNAHWLDYDGDSDLDIFTVRQGYQQLNTFQSIYQNQGEDEFNQTNILLPGYSVTGNAWADYDNDGDLDLVGESAEGAIQKTGIWQNNDNNFTFVELTATTSIKNGVASWGDYDSDGDSDLILTGVDAEDESQARTQLFNNDGDGNLTEVDANLTGNVGTVDWGDADNDGDLDLIISGTADPQTDSFTTTVYLNNDGTFDGVFTVEDVKQGTVKWGDFNGDNNLDFAVVGGVETEIIVDDNGEEQVAIVDRGFARIYQGDGAGGFDLLQEVEGVQDSSVDWGDYDNDGDLDLLITGLSNQFRLTADGEFVRIPATFIYRYDEETNSFSQIIPNLPEVGGGNSSWGDYDSDGDLDILVSGFDFFNNPITKVYRNDGYGTYANEWQQSDFGNHILFGAGVRRDVFVIDTESEIETIYSFKPGQDLLYLSNGLTFDDLELQDLESGDTAIVLKSDNRTLAILQDVTAAEISESDLVITLNKDSRNVVLDNFNPERDLIYLTEGLNEDVIEFVAAENNTQIILSGTEEVIATINNASIEDIESNLLTEQINFIDPVFTAFNNDSRLASFDYELNGLAPGDYTLRGTAYDHETANEIISQGVTLINPLLEIPNSDREFVLEDRAYDSDTANEIISQNINPSTEVSEQDTEIIELEGTQVIDWIYQVGSTIPDNADEGIYNTVDRSNGIAVDSTGRVHFVGTTGGILPGYVPSESEQQEENRDFWYGSIASQGTSPAINQVLTTSGRIIFEGGELFEAGGNVIRVAGIVAYENSLYTIRNFTDDNTDEDGNINGNLFFTRIEQIDPATREIVRSIDAEIADSNRQDLDLAVDSLGNLYSVGFTNASRLGNAFLSKYDRETLFNSESLTIGTDDGSTGASAIAISSDDSIYLTGDTTGKLVPGISKDEFDQRDIWVAKYQNTESGLEQVWLQQFSLGEVEFAQDIAVDSENNVYVTGEITGIEGGDIVGKDRIWLTKFQADGDREWTRILDFDSSLADLPKGITIDESDNIYITGENRTGESSNSQTDVFLAKYDTESNLIWTQNFGTSANDDVENLTVDGAGNLYLTGSTLSGLNGQNQGSGDAWVAKFNDIENSDRIEKERFILGDSTGNFYGSGNIARITGFDAAIGDTIQLHGSSEDYVLDAYFVQRQVDGVFRVVETGVNISYKPNDDAFPEEIARIVDGSISTSDRQLGLRITTEFEAGNIDFVSAREDNVESTDFTINNNGTSEDDELIGTADASDVLTGGDGNDKLVGNLGRDYLDGGTGNDTLYSGTESEPSEAEIENSDESTTYSFLYGWEGNDELYGSGFADELYGGTGNDVIIAGAGNDTLDGGQGDDVLDGGAGTDVISFRDELASVVVNLETGTVRDSQNGTDTFSNIEGAIASEYADTILGDANDNVLTGLAGDDVITAGAGNDTIEAGQGSDIVDAGAGNDTIINDDGNDTLLGGEGDDIYDLKQQAELTVEEAFTALGGGNRQQGYIYNADNFPISFDTFRRFVFDGLTPELAEFGLEIVEIVTEEGSEDTEPVLGDDGFSLLRQVDYPLQILDEGGEDDTLILDGVDIQEVNIENNEYPSTRGDRIGVAQRGSSLVIDYNQDVYPSLENDIVINNFFDFDNPGEAGTGFIETLDGIDSTEILALAQPFTPIDFEVPEVETGFWTNSGSWGDYDNDGDLDFAIASGDDAGNGFTRIYRNDEGEFVFAASLEGYSEVTSLDWGDYDGDGDLDVVIAGKDGQPTQNDDGTFDSNSTYSAAVFRNEGGDRFSNVESIDLEDEDGSSVKDGNGEPIFKEEVGNGDLVLDNDEPIYASWGNYITVDGNFLRPEDEDPLELTLYYEDKLDILFRQSSQTTDPEWGYLGVAQNIRDSFDEVEKWAFDTRNGIGSGSSATNAWGDYDNDGDLDVLVVESSQITLYTNDENGDFEETDTFSLNNLAENSDGEPISLKSSASFGDYDNDGFLDILTTRYSADGYAQVSIFQGNGTEEFTEIPTLIPNTYNGEASWGDYDNDGDLDILLIGTAGEDNEEGLPFAQIYRNNIATPDTSNTAPKAPKELNITTGSFDDFEFIPDNGGVGEDIRFEWSPATDEETADVSLTYNLRIGTTPGGSEFLAAGISNNGTLLSPEIGNVGTNLEYVLNNTSGLKRGVTYYWSVQAVDGGYLGSEFAAESSFTYLPYDETPTEIEAVNGNSAWGDYDGDGDLDLVKGTDLFDNNLGESETTFNLAETTFNPDLSLAESAEDDRVDNAWGDYDGDGDLDLAVTGNTTAIYRNDANGSGDNEDESVNLDLSLPQVNNGAIAWGDYDNDGDLDLFSMGRGENGLIAEIHSNEGELGFALDENQSELVGLSNGDAAWADYDNDGDLDLAVIGKNNTNVTIAGIYQNNLGILGNFIALNPEGSEYISEDNPNSIAWGDYDSDGYLDLLVTAATNTDSYHQIYQNNQDGSFSNIEAEQLGETSPNGKSTWADFNNDGQLDVILSGEQHAAFENQNGQFQRTYFRDVDVLNFDNALAVADYDRDGDLDFLANPTGNNNRLGTIIESSAPAIYENLLQDRANNLPTAPTELTAATNKNSVTLEWNLGSDEETPVEGLTYNLRVGTTPGGNDIVASMSDGEGLRSLPALGNVNYNTQWNLSDLPNGTYYWSVQTIDSTFAGSAFSDEGEFTISNPQVEIQNIEIQEGDSGEVEAEFTVTLNVETIDEPVTVDYATVDGTATAGEDYEATSGTLTFNPATEDNPVELTKTVRVKVFGDREDEENETFSIQLSNVSDNAEILASADIATATIDESEETDGDALLPDYSFTELKVNGTETNISLERGSLVNIEGAIANLTEFTPENPPSYRFYISEDETIDPVLNAEENDSLVVDDETGLITNVPTGVELSEDIALVPEVVADENSQDENSQPVLEDGNYIFDEENILIPTTLEDGDYFLIAEVNQREIQPEAELNNNLLAIPISITAPTEATPEQDSVSENILENNRQEALETNPNLLVDLAVSNVNISNLVQPGGSLDVSFTVTNAENNSALVESGTWITQIYLSDDNVPDASDSLLKETIIEEALPVNSNQIITDTVEFPNSLSGGEHLFVIASPIEQLDLESENNISIVPLDI